MRRTVPNPDSGPTCAPSPGLVPVSYTHLDVYKRQAVGLDIHPNHLRAATNGWVTGTARPVHIGRTTQVWQIDIANEAGDMVCVSRITMAVLGAR